MYNRDPRDRVSKIAPWLTLDGDPYPAVVDGKILWIVDGYTTINNFPYAQQTSLGTATNDSLNGVAKQANSSINYIRNSVKATVDAFNGTVNLYALDDKEPVLNAWEKVFPGVVKPSSEITPSLRAHFRYPEDLFKIQRELLSPPGESRTTFQLTSSLTGLQRQYLASWVSVSSDPDDYGTIRVLKLPTGASGATQVDGPVQVQNRFQSDPRVAQDRTLFNNPNVRVTYGNLITLPVADGFLYVEPVYIRQSNQVTSYPQLARVLVSFGPKIGFASTLQEALDQVFGSGTGAATATPPQAGAPTSPTTPTAPGTTTTPPPAGGSNPALDKAVADIQAALTRLKNAQSSGNFTEQGAALAALDAATKAYEAAKTSTPAAPPPTTTTPPG